MVPSVAPPDQCNHSFCLSVYLLKGVLDDVMLAVVEHFCHLCRTSHASPYMNLLYALTLLLNPSFFLI